MGAPPPILDFVVLNFLESEWADSAGADPYVLLEELRILLLGITWGGFHMDWTGSQIHGGVTCWYFASVREAPHSSVRKRTYQAVAGVLRAYRAGVTLGFVSQNPG